MKRFLSILMLLTLCLTLIACDGKQKPSAEPETGPFDMSAILPFIVEQEPEVMYSLPYYDEYKELEWAIKDSGNVVLARYLDEVKVGSVKFRKFEITEQLKGATRTDHILMQSAGDSKRFPKYYGHYSFDDEDKGKVYLLCLTEDPNDVHFTRKYNADLLTEFYDQKFAVEMPSFLYYPTEWEKENFDMLHGEYLANERWQKIDNIIKTALEEVKDDVAESKYDYVRENDVKKIVDGSDVVLKVRVIAPIRYGDRKNYTIGCRCKVIKQYKGDTVEKEAFIFVNAEDFVNERSHEYIVCLNGVRFKKDNVNEFPQQCYGYSAVHSVQDVGKESQIKEIIKSKK